METVKKYFSAGKHLDTFSRAFVRSDKQMLIKNVYFEAINHFKSIFYRSAFNFNIN